VQTGELGEREEEEEYEREGGGGGEGLRIERGPDPIGASLNV
jgi:hypothetical protein